MQYGIPGVGRRSIGYWATATIPPDAVMAIIYGRSYLKSYMPYVTF